MSGSSLDRESPALLVLRSIAVVSVALALGVLTAYAQGWLPDQLAPLANSTGSWVLVACALSLVGTSAGLAAALGSASLLALLGGYVLGAEIRGFPSSQALIIFWGAAGVLAGPVLGLSTHLIKTRRDQVAAIGVGVVSGVLVGEGCYGLTEIADTTYPPYWWGEILVGLVLLFAVGRRLTGIRAVSVAVSATVLTTVAFVVVYRGNLMALVPGV